MKINLAEKRLTKPKTVEPRTSAMRALVILPLLALSACSQPDWRPPVIAAAETKAREDISDPAAQFTRVQLTGDAATGQTCGYVTGNVGPFGLEHTMRFIVYIDATAGPYVEAGFGKHPQSREDFEGAWNADCLKEGYKA